MTLPFLVVVTDCLVWTVWRLVQKTSCQWSQIHLDHQPQQ